MIEVFLLKPTANVCTCSIVHNNVKVIATAAGIFANEALVICLRYRSLQSKTLCHILAPVTAECNAWLMLNVTLTLPRCDDACKIPGGNQDLRASDR